MEFEVKLKKTKSFVNSKLDFYIITTNEFAKNHHSKMCILLVYLKVINILGPTL